MVKKIHRLRCDCTQYPWGKKGTSSLAARLGARSGLAVDADTPYAELWMGTHPNLPARLFSSSSDTSSETSSSSSSSSLDALLRAHPEELVGPAVLARYPEPTLAFLPKVLSIATALPLQVHPDKLMAERLHTRDPAAFADDNHKPEIAVAITEFEAFCGFRPRAEIETTLRLAPLERFLPGGDGDGGGGGGGARELDAHGLRDVVERILTADEGVVEEALRGLAGVSKKDLGKAAYIADLLPRLQEQHGPKDPGILCALATMNYLRLSPGQALYVPADGLHAWLSGDIVECMARSDNVLNVGLCPPDARSPVADFLECLTLDPASPDACILAGTRRQGGVTVEYAPPLGEFRVLALDAVGRPARDETWTAAAGPGVFWVVEGKGSVRAEGEEFAVEAGDVYFIGHHTELKLDGDMKAYMAFTH